MFKIAHLSSEPQTTSDWLISLLQKRISVISPHLTSVNVSSTLWIRLSYGKKLMCTSKVGLIQANFDIFERGILTKFGRERTRWTYRACWLQREVSSLHFALATTSQRRTHNQAGHLLESGRYRQFIWFLISAVANFKFTLIEGLFLLDYLYEVIIISLPGGCKMEMQTLPSL